MAIDLLKIQPNKVSKDLNSYQIYIFGPGGVGKTTLSAQMDKALLIAFEAGYSAIPGVMAQDVTTWGEFKQVVRELKKPEVRETFSCLVIDTIDIAASLCEKYVCSQNNVENLSDLAWGKGFRLVKQELEETFRLLSHNLGYALFFISHSKDKTFKPEDGDEYNQIVPTLSTSYNEIIRNMCDIQGYAHPVRHEDGSSSVMLTLRSPDGRVECKSRFKMIDPEIEFNYESLANALHEAIDREAKLTNGKFVTQERANSVQQKEYDFDALMKEFNDMVSYLRTSMDKEQFAKTWAPKITSITTLYLGKGRKVNECSEDQAEQLDLIVSDLRDAIKASAQ